MYQRKTQLFLNDCRCLDWERHFSLDGRSFGKLHCRFFYNCVIRKWLSQLQWYKPALHINLKYRESFSKKQKYKNAVLTANMSLKLIEFFSGNEYWFKTVFFFDSQSEQCLENADPANQTDTLRLSWNFPLVLGTSESQTVLVPLNFAWSANTSEPLMKGRDKQWRQMGTISREPLISGLTWLIVWSGVGCSISLRQAIYRPLLVDEYTPRYKL